MLVIVTGATGFIGKALSVQLLGAGYDVVALSRDARRGRQLLGDHVSVVEWDGESSRGWESYAEGAFAIINLAGENISSGRWTEAKKHKILQSRLDAGRAIVEAVKKVEKKPKVVIQSSGIGYYGSRADEVVDESSSPGEGFLVEVAKRWEQSTKEVDSVGIRHVVIRTGIVLGGDGGALPRLLTPFRLFVGGSLGNGRQWFPWIHLDDELRAIQFLMEKEELNGAFNLCAPQPLKMKEFCRILGKALRRPSWLPVPSFLLRVLFSQMADEALLSGQRAMPRRLMEAGYRFCFSNVESALRNILS